VRRTGGNHFQKENEINNQIITQTFGDYPVEFTKDGFVNIIQMCRAYSAATGILKKPADFLRLDQTIRFIEELKKSVEGNPSTVQHGGSSRGTWVNQDLVMECARWLCPDSPGSNAVSS